MTPVPQLGKPSQPELLNESPKRSELPIDEVVPRFDTGIFLSRQEAAFYVGILAAPGGIVLDQNAWDAARRLRAKVYIDEEGFLPESSRKEDGGEDDQDDLRSVQFGVYQNVGSGHEAKLAGTSRLILKRDESDLLPVEAMYPDVFAEKPAEVNGSETSRVVARHADKVLTRKAISLSLIRAMAAYSVSEAQRPVYATIDPPIKAMYDRMNFPYELLSDLRYLEEYKSKNWAARIEPQDVIDMVNPANHSNGLIQAFFAGVHKDRGLGYYDASLANRIAN
jgi:N-acyl-L-homoserine lactone synthetase